MINSTKNYWQAIIALVVACSLWGTAFLFGKVAMAELAVSQVVLLRFTLASLALLPLAALRGNWPQLHDIPLFLLTGFLTVPVTFLLQFGGLALTSVARASLIVGALPSLLALAATLFQSERLNKRGWVAVTGSTLGVIWIVGLPELGIGWLGDVLVFLSLITTVCWVLLSKKLSQKYDALTATTFILAFGALTLLPISLFWDGLPHLQMSGEVWASILALGLLCTASTFGLWNWALERIPASRASVFVNLQPVIGAGLGVMILHEPLRPSVLVGGLLVITAAWMISKPEQGVTQPLEQTLEPA